MKLTTYKGIDIEVTEEGRFEAHIPGVGTTGDRTLSKVKAAIDKAEPTVRLMRVSNHFASVSTSVYTASDVRQGSHYGKIIDGENPEERLAEVDEDVIERIHALITEENEAKKALNQQYYDRRMAILDKVPSVTADEVSELLREEQRKRLSHG